MTYQIKLFLSSEFKSQIETAFTLELLLIFASNPLPMWIVSSHSVIYELMCRLSRNRPVNTPDDSPVRRYREARQGARGGNRCPIGFKSHDTSPGRPPEPELRLRCR